MSKSGGAKSPAIPGNTGVTITSSITQPARSTGGHHAEGQGYGLVFFASVLLVIVGCFNLIYGIAAIANSHVFTANAHYVFGSLRTWGLDHADHRPLAAAGGGRGASGQPVDRGKPGMKRSSPGEGWGIPLGRVLAPANRHDSPLLAPTLDKPSTGQCLYTSPGSKSSK